MVLAVRLVSQVSRTDVQKKSDKQEKRTAETYRGSVNVMSGAGWRRKNDVTTTDFLIENKTKMSSDSKSYSIKAQDLRELSQRAAIMGRMPLFQLDLGGHSYVVLDQNDFLMMMEDD